jgi:hypothetical protein
MSERFLFRPILVAAALTSPIASVLLLLAQGGYGQIPYNVVTDLFTGTVGSFICLLVANVTIGTPLSLLLRRRGIGSGAHHALAGLAVPLVALGGFILFDWHFGKSGPFWMTQRDIAAHEGLGTYTMRTLSVAACLGFSGAINGYVFWRNLRSNISLQADRER